MEARVVRNVWRVGAIAALALAILCMGMAFSAQPAHAKAKASTTKIKIGKTYKKFDITGDGKADRICFRNDVDYDACINVGRLYVNGRSVWRYPTGAGFDPEDKESVFKICTLQNGRSFLFVHAGLASTVFTRIVGYSHGKLQDVNVLSAFGKKIEATYQIGYAAVDASASGNTITCAVNFSVIGIEDELSELTAKVKYKFKSGRMALKSKTAQLKKTKFTASKSSKAYAASTGSKVAFKIKAGDKLTATKMLCGSKPRVLVKNSKGKKGWIKISYNRRN